MKKLSFTLLAVLLVTGAWAQKIKDIDLTYKYLRLPSSPLDKSIKSYKPVVFMPYEAENAEKKASYDKKVQMAEQQYKLDMQAYDQQVKLAEDQYAKEMEEYNKKSTAQKIIDKKVLDESKPVKHLPSAPYKQLPQEEIYKKVYDKQLLADNYVKLDGYEQGTDNPVVITVTIYGFENTAPTVKSETSSYVDTKGQTSSKTKYHYEFSYRLPMSVKVEAGGKTLLNQNFEKQSEYKVYKTKDYDNESDLRRSNDPKVMVDQMEETLLKENMKEVMEVVNSRFGKSTVERKTVLNNVESKKMDYSDFDQSYQAAAAAYAKMSENKPEAQASLQTAIAGWEKAMQESNPNDKKARVDAGVSMATLFNLGEAYIYVEDFAKAEASINKIMTLDPSKKEKKAAEELMSFMKDMKQRYEANKG